MGNGGGMLDDLADGQVWSSAALPTVNMPVCVVCVTGGGPAPHPDLAAHCWKGQY